MCRLRRIPDERSDREEQNVHDQDEEELEALLTDSSLPALAVVLGPIARWCDYGAEAQNGW